MAEDREITAKINTVELAQKWEELANKAKEITVDTLIGAKTDLGCVRENNEDKFEFFLPDDEETLATKGAFYGVADGMGGHAAGQIASEIALKTVIRAYYADKSIAVEDSLRAAVQYANGLIYDLAQAIIERKGMGTTITAMVIRGEEAYIAQVGDSRCYRLRQGNIEQLTNDHSWVYEQVQRGALTLADAELSPFKNVITRSIGNAPSVEVDIFTETIKPGDQYLLCSDGLSNEVNKDEIKQAMVNGSPSQAAWDLIELARERGGRDNCTALVIKILDIREKQPKAKGWGFFGGRG